MGIEELIAVAKRRGLSAISVTDHDTTAAATRAVVIGRRQELTFSPNGDYVRVKPQPETPAGK